VNTPWPPPQRAASTDASVADVAFASGEEVKVLKEWGNETCLVRKGDGKVFNVPKKYLNL
jgi:hypothetical protein